MADGRHGLLQVLRTHPAITVLGAAALTMIDGLHVAAAVLTGIGFGVLVRRPHARARGRRTERITAGLPR